jgi:hypothetical protein
VTGCWGLMAEFTSAEALLAAAQRVRAAGYRQVEAYSPFPVEGLAEELGYPKTPVPFWTFLGALAGGVGGYFMQWYAAVIDYPVNIAGRPLHSWPMFVPLTFELAVLGGAFAAVISFFAASGLPKLRHPLFASPDFDLATRNRFFLCLRSEDPAFALEPTRDFLQSLQPMACVEVAP